MTAEPEPQHIQLRYRNVGTLVDDEDDLTVEVDHVYIPEGQAGTCCHGDCGKPAHDPGVVGIIIATGGEDDGAAVSALLTPEQALYVANRLTRAANLVLESGEDVADIEREAARYTETVTGQERGAA